jgi:hypothetical protein
VLLLDSSVFVLETRTGERRIVARGAEAAVVVVVDDDVVPLATYRPCLALCMGPFLVQK